MTSFCSGCGRYLNGEELQCPDCGKYTQKGLQQKVPNDKEKIRMRDNIILIGLCILGIAIILLL